LQYGIPLRIHECSDCGVSLVDHLPEDASSGDGKTRTDSEEHELLWKGISPGPYGQIRQALDDAGIFHKDTTQEFGILPTLTQSVEFIWIDPHDHHAAQTALAEALRKYEEGEQEDSELIQDTPTINPLRLNRFSYSGSPSEDGERTPYESSSGELEESEEPTPDDIVEDFDPEDATTEVWDGEDAEAADNFKSCLNGVGIACIVSEDGGKSRILVLPAEEARARKVIREIVEQKQSQ
jgi:hypothetical protein